MEGNIISGVTVQTRIASSSDGIDAPAGERGPGGAGSKVGCRDAWRGNVAFRDTGAIDDPFVIGLDHLFKIGIGQHARWYVTPDGGNHRFESSHQKAVGNLLLCSDRE